MKNKIEQIKEILKDTNEYKKLANTYNEIMKNDDLKKEYQRYVEAQNKYIELHIKNPTGNIKEKEKYTQIAIDVLVGNDIISRFTDQQTIVDKMLINILRQLQQSLLLIKDDE